MINRTIVVTGASRGIGKETLLLLASNPTNRLIALSRDLDLMEQHFGHLPNVFSHRFDLNEAIPPQAEKIFTGIDEVNPPEGKTDFFDFLRNWNIIEN